MNWQSLITVAVVCLAAIFLGRRLYRSMSARGGGGCSRCREQPPSDHGITGQQIISVDDLKRSAGETGPNGK